MRPLPVGFVLQVMPKIHPDIKAESSCKCFLHYYHVEFTLAMLVVLYKKQHFLVLSAIQSLVNMIDFQWGNYSVSASLKFLRVIYDPHR